ncbi:MAG: sulfatase-like hydrolase/transferase [Selenomonadaceae bacterium]|nr:sulfatase-like hydrolase/transferase [Selenomonadaceae bacterium]MDD6398053.1 sulfatase-like hydrolase/transferase [Selenomonadaceae bacterium]
MSYNKGYKRIDSLVQGGLKLVVRGLLVFFFYLAVLSLCRAVFCYVLAEYLGQSTSWADIQLALASGTRLSVQTSGIMALVTLVPAGLTGLVKPAWGHGLQKLLSGITLLVTDIGFFASFPYYQQFHSRFNQLFFNAVNDDMYALFISFIQEFNLIPRLIGAIAMTVILWKLLQYLWGKCDYLIGQVRDAAKSLHYGLQVLLALMLVIIYIWGRLVIFGGSLSWENAVDWENAGVTKDEFLNEVILDDYQALYRGYRMNSRMLACNGLNFTAEQIKQLAAQLSGKPADSDNLDVYLQREAQGAQIAKPKHIFVIVSESYANWPLLPQYEKLHIADGMKGVIAAADSDYCPAMLPNGSSTVSAVTGIVTGLADANLYLTTMPESFKEPYPTAIAPQMEKLGYATSFWYAGPATWERVGAFTTAQGFQHFYSRGDMPENAAGSVWGCDDEYLYEAVLQGVPQEQDTFSVVLNVSNHSPYTIDLEAKGFPEETVRSALPEELQNDAGLLKELGHYWYADKEMAEFITKIKAKYADALIVVVGDHGDRYNLEKMPGLYERYTVPFIITGNGVHKGLLLPDSAGSQIDIGPTLLELIAPKGFKYMSIGSSLSRNNRMGINYGFYITRDFIGESYNDPPKMQAIPSGTGKAVDMQQLQNYMDAVHSISWWRPKYGPVLDESLLEGRE